MSISVCTTDTVPGRKIIACKGLVSSNDIFEISTSSHDIDGAPYFTGGADKISRARESLVDDMVRKASRLGADAVVGVCFATTVIDPWKMEMAVFGTAVETRALDGSE